MKFNSRNVYISPRATIGNNVKIGDNTIVYDNVVIEDNVIIADNCIIGEPTGDYYYSSIYTNPQTFIGKNSLIRSFTIIYADVMIGEGLSTGHRVTIREKTIMGINCRVGTMCDIQGLCNIGDCCWFHSNVFVAQYSTIGNYVFIYPHVILANDKYPPSNDPIGPTIEDYAQIAAQSTILAGARIGRYALIGAGSVVTTDVPEYQLVFGNPAKLVKDVRTIMRGKEGTYYYPWPENFERGMPWEHIGYKTWNEQQYKP